MYSKMPTNYFFRLWMANYFVLKGKLFKSFCQQLLGLFKKKQWHKCSTKHVQIILINKNCLPLGVTILPYVFKGKTLQCILLKPRDRFESNLTCIVLTWTSTKIVQTSLNHRKHGRHGAGPVCPLNTYWKLLVENFLSKTTVGSKLHDNRTIPFS